MGEQLPRVTEILNATGLGPDLSHVPPDILAAALERGTAVHALVEAQHYGYLDEAAVTPELTPYLAAFRMFLAESKYEPIACEIEVVDTRWSYRGHPDLVGWLLGNRVVLDVKTGDATGGKYQVAAYGAAWTAERPTEPVKAGAILHVRADATYRFEEIEMAPALDVFHAAVIVHRAQQRRSA